jgi:hypothetical protein
MLLNACWEQEVVPQITYHHNKKVDHILFHYIICKMPFEKGLKGENGNNKNGRKQGSQRRHINTRKGSKKSPTATSATPVARM